MIQEGMDFCEMNRMNENKIRELVIRVLTRIEDAWDQYLDDIAEGRPNARVKMAGSLTSCLLKEPLED